MQSHEQTKAKQQLKLIPKSEKQRQLVGETDSIGLQEYTPMLIPKDAKNKIRSNDGYGMKTDQV